MSKPWYEIKNAGNEEAEVHIYGEIGTFGITAKAFIDSLNAVKAKRINLRVNSVGGGIFEGTAIYNAIKRHAAHVTTHIDGLAASMAGVVALAGDEVRMASNAMFMVHNPWALRVGDAEDMARAADLLDKLKSNLLDVYEAKTRRPREELSAFMDDETWFTAEQAKAVGFIDVIAPEVRVAACVGSDFDLRCFQHTPSNLLASIPSRAIDENSVTVQELLAKLETAERELAVERARSQRKRAETEAIAETLAREKAAKAGIVMPATSTVAEAGREQAGEQDTTLPPERRLANIFNKADNE
jgi:ATP-dependent Clp endopeptidase proteolytic subunit ClpP